MPSYYPHFSPPLHIFNTGSSISVIFSSLSLPALPTTRPPSQPSHLLYNSTTTAPSSWFSGRDRFRELNAQQIIPLIIYMSKPYWFPESCVHPCASPPNLSTYPMPLYHPPLSPPPHISNTLGFIYSCLLPHSITPHPSHPHLFPPCPPTSSLSYVQTPLVSEILNRYPHFPS